jgi:hypothetical protein
MSEKYLRRNETFAWRMRNKSVRKSPKAKPATKQTNLGCPFRTLNGGDEHHGSKKESR